MFRYYLRKLQSNFLNYRPKSIPLTKDIKTSIKELNNKGISINNNLIKKNKKLVKELRGINNFLENFNIDNYPKTAINEYSDFDQILNLIENKKTSICIKRDTGYYFSKNEEKFLSVDKGMYDLISPEYLDDSIKNSLYIIKETFLKKILKEINIIYKKKFTFSHSSLYIYQGNTSPRWIHYDSFFSQIKLFIPLVDINSIDQGPYCYVIGSHKNKIFKIINTFINKIFGSDVGINYRDGSLLSLAYVTPIFNNKYDIIFSDNTGYHGDIPASNDKKNKSILVLNLLCK